MHSHFPDIENRKGYIFDIQKFSIHDGPGIRTTVFFKGCPLSCLWCHNPESKQMLPEKLKGCSMRKSFNSVRFIPSDEIGKEISVKEVLDEVEKDNIFYEESGGGVSFSGGEPLMQPEFLRALLISAKEKNIHTVVDTCAYASFSLFNSIYNLVDLFLVDIKLMNDDRHKEFTGVSNKLILDNIKSLSPLVKGFIIRIPIIPGYNDDKENIEDLIKFISDLKNIIEVDLLPYHSFGELKYLKMKLHETENKIISPSGEKMIELKKRFEMLPFPVKIGG